MAILLQIFPLVSPFVQENEGVLSLLSKLKETDYSKVVVIGPDRVDKTSLVFQASVSTAAVGGHVTYICTHPLKKLPHPVHGMSAPEPNIMNNVDFLYFEEVTDLIAWCASIHKKPKLPSLIVVEDILSYAVQINENNIEKSLAKLCALLSNVVSWVHENSDAKTCSVLITAPSRASTLKNILEQFDFKTALYQGPEKEGKASTLTVTSSSSAIIVNFHRQGDSIMMTNVEGRYLYS